MLRILFRICLAIFIVDSHLRVNVFLKRVEILHVHLRSLSGRVCRPAEVEFHSTNISSFHLTDRLHTLILTRDIVPIDDIILTHLKVPVLIFDYPLPTPALNALITPPPNLRPVILGHTKPTRTSLKFKFAPYPVSDIRQPVNFREFEGASVPLAPERGYLLLILGLVSDPYPPQRAGKRLGVSLIHHGRFVGEFSVDTLKEVDTSHLGSVVEGEMAYILLPKVPNRLEPMGKAGPVPVHIGEGLSVI